MKYVSIRAVKILSNMKLWKILNWHILRNILKSLKNWHPSWTEHLIVERNWICFGAFFKTFQFILLMCHFSCSNSLGPVKVVGLEHPEWVFPQVVIGIGSQKTMESANQWCICLWYMSIQFHSIHQWTKHECAQSYFREAEKLTTSKGCQHFMARRSPLCQRPDGTYGHSTQGLIT